MGLPTQQRNTIPDLALEDSPDLDSAQDLAQDPGSTLNLALDNSPEQDDSLDLDDSLVLGNFLGLGSTLNLALDNSLDLCASQDLGSAVNLTLEKSPVSAVKLDN